MAWGVSLTEDEIAFFEKRIRPVLVEKCYECHSASPKNCKVICWSILERRSATVERKGVRHPGDVEKSLLIQAIRYETKRCKCRRMRKLSDAEIADLTEWIRMGAPDPRSTATKHLGKQIDVAEARQFWSLKPLSTPTIPRMQTI